jgi:hypothetical protein
VTSREYEIKKEKRANVGKKNGCRKERRHNLNDKGNPKKKYSKLCDL